MDKQTSTVISLEALKAGDREAFSQLVEMYSGRLYRLALKLLQNPQDAEDVLQETFIKAFRYIHNFDGRSSVSTWLYRIATNEALMQLRRKHPEMVSIEEPVEDGDMEQEPLQIVDWCCLPEQELLSSETRRRLDDAVKVLPDTLKTVFLLRDIEDLSTAETAEVLGLTETAVKTRLSRARLRLREELSVYYAESPATVGDNLRDIKPHILSTVPRLLEKVFDRIMNSGRKLTGVKKMIFFWAVRTGDQYNPNPEKRSWIYNIKLKLAACLQADTVFRISFEPVQINTKCVDTCIC